MKTFSIISKVFALLSLFSLVLSCHTSTDQNFEKEQISALMDQTAKAHFSKDAAQFYAPYADNWLDVRNGEIQEVSKEEAIGPTQNYLDNMEFEELQESDPPVIEISDDGSLASYIGAVTVKGKLKGKPLFWAVSWQSVLRKADGKWQIISTANTEATEAGTAQVILQKAQQMTGMLPDSSTIYALADCRGPGGPFKTLLLSSLSESRMEQASDRYHIILKSGKENSWSFDVQKNDLKEEMDSTTRMFVQGHELHWLCYRPQDRLRNPVFKGFAEYRDQTAFKIQFSDDLDRPLNFYYTFKNYQPLGFDTPTDQEGERVQVYFADWQQVENLQVFHQATFEQGEYLFNYTFTEIKIDNSNPQDFKSREPLID